MPDHPPAHGIRFGAALRVWLRIGLLSFGGPAGQIALMHRIIVEEKRWVGEQRFLHALNYCMLLPGPEAQQLATYLGWLLHRGWGGIAAGTLFVLPGALAVAGLAVLSVTLRDAPAVATLFAGLKPAVVALVLAALVRIGGRALRTPAAWTVAALAFAAIAALHTPFPAVVAGAAVVGWIGGARGWFAPPPVPAAAAIVTEPAIPDAALAVPAPRPGASVRTGLLWLALWLAPIAALTFWRGADDLLATQARTFAGMAAVAFGGAYALLDWLRQVAVQAQGWVAPGEMVDALGLAETTPGPLILVVPFIGFLGAHHAAEGAPVLVGLLAFAIACWAIFAPSFLWIFVGAPWIERLRGHRRLDAALAAVTAAVVGVILHLGLWFALHVLFRVVRRTGAWEIPVWSSLDPLALLLALAAGVALVRFRLGLGWVLAGCVAVMAVVG